MRRMGWILVVVLSVGIGAAAAIPITWAADKPEAVQVAKAQVNINKASAKELAALKGIGDGLATAIVDYRTKNGPFQKVEDLLKVKGIGKKKLASIQGQISVQ